MEKEEHIAKFKEGNISIILNSYNDLFSDFDPRPYNVRALSDDFLVECKKATVEKDEQIRLRFMIPRKNRNAENEIEIKKRLKDYFKKYFYKKESEIKKLKRSGFLWFFCGAVVMTLGAFLLRYEGFVFDILITILEPAGWFFFWEGLAKVVIEPKQKMPDHEFYKKMSDSKIVFVDY